MIYAYPCEGLFGLGCDPLSKKDVIELCNLKKRSLDKGLILISGTFDHFEPYINHLNSMELKKLKSKWPGPHTWLVRANQNVPDWIKGDSNFVALRQSAHLSVVELTNQFGGVITSTSANVSEDAPAKTSEEVFKIFGHKVKIIQGEIGTLESATPIQNLETGEWIRK